MAHVADLTHNDNDMSNPSVLAPGEPFVKGWRVRNVGTCTWNSAYQLVYVGGNAPAARMGGEPVPITRNVSPGESYDLQVELAAPLTPGTYQGFWQMSNADGVPFGRRIWAGVHVPAPATPTPPPTQTPAPGISFSVERTHISAGECVALTWSVENVKAVYLFAQGEPWQQNGVPGQGSRQVCPPVTTVYELLVIKPDDVGEVRQIRIEVEPVAGAPEIQRFWVNPDYQALVGQVIEIQWQVEGAVTRVRILRNATELWADAPWSGEFRDAAAGPGSATYAIEASGPGGMSRLQRVVNIVAPATPVPSPTPTVPATTPVPSLPLIDGFAVSPNIVHTGECVNLSWRVVGNADRIQLKRDHLVVLDNAPSNGTAQQCLSDIGVMVYRIEAINSADQFVFREEPVSVIESSSGNPLGESSWRLASYKDGTGGLVSVLEGTTLTAAFGAEGDLSGSAGCNTFFTTYSIDGDKLTVSPAAISRQVCTEPEGITEQESAYLAALQSAATFELNDDQLVVRNGAGQTALIFVRQ